MRRAKTFAGVERERERERATTLINKNQAKKLALLSICRASTKHEKCLECLSFLWFKIF